jgi:hypothetical protein
MLFVGIELAASAMIENAFNVVLNCQWKQDKETRKNVE